MVDRELVAIEDMTARQFVRQFHQDLASGSFVSSDRQAVIELTRDVYAKLVKGLGELLEDEHILEGLRK